MTTDGPIAAKNGSPQPAELERRIRRIGAICAAAVLGGLAGLIGLVAITSMRNQHRMPELGPAEFLEHRQRWEAAGVTDYRIQVRVTGRQAAVYQVDVRDGVVHSASRNDVALKQRRTMGTWSVPGMFTTISSDVSNLEKHRRGVADRQTPQVLLRGQFDLEFGYPVRYHRTEFRKWATNTEVSWEVLSFEVLQPGSEPS